MPGGFDHAAISAVRPTFGVEGSIGTAGTVAPGDDGSALAVVGGGGIQHRALFDTGVGGILQDRRGFKNRVGL